MVVSRLGLQPARVLSVPALPSTSPSNLKVFGRAHEPCGLSWQQKSPSAPRQTAWCAPPRGWVLCSASDQSVATPQSGSSRLLGYRQNVGVCLINRSGQVFTARRLDDSTQTWQMPQGGIDKGEAARAAAMRELREETGVSSARIVGEASAWLQYDFPPDVLAVIRANGRCCHRGQRQKWFLMLFEGGDAEVDLKQPEPEFSEFKWTDLHQMLLEVVPFKRDVYTAVVREFAPLIAARLQGGQWVD